MIWADLNTFIAHSTQLTKSVECLNTEGWEWKKAPRSLWVMRHQIENEIIESLWLLAQIPMKMAKWKREKELQYTSFKCTCLWILLRSIIWSIFSRHRFIFSENHFHLLALRSQAIFRKYLMDLKDFAALILFRLEIRKTFFRTWILCD